MKVVMEFYRTRNEDDAHAVVGRETGEFADLAGAIEAAWLLVQTLDMPQRPDAMKITDTNGTTLYCGTIDADAISQRRQ